MSDLSNGAPDDQRWWSRAILIGALLAAALLPVGALGARFGIWTFGFGFLLLAAGAVLAAVGLVTGIVGLIAAYRGGLRTDKPPLYLGTLISVLILAVLGSQFMAASAVPPIHDISTSVTDPPSFEAVVPLRGEGANPLDFNADEIAPAQAEFYPWVQTLQTDLAPDQALARTRQVLEDMGLEIVAVDAAAGRVEATDTTFWFGFKDDVVVRVRPDPAPGAGSVVDVRSISRVGVSDLGVNARRIGTFLDSFQPE